MLPVKTGFIFPDGRTLDTGTIGHDKCAYRYIEANKLTKAFDAYKREVGGESSDFMIESLGCLKVAHYSGVHYVYVPRMRRSALLTPIIKKYKRSGYNIVYVGKEWIYNTKTAETRTIIRESFSYNQTLVPIVNKEGNTIYLYNPLRNGD